jgi:glycosyltransferase involved in cell wall biosynthesis
MKRPDVLALVDKIGWFGRHTGYEMLPRFLPGVEVRQVRPRPTFITRAVGKAYCIAKGWAPRDQTATFSELESLVRAHRSPGGFVHVLYAENHLQFFTRWRRAPRNWLVTLHLPPSQWSRQQQDQLGHVQSALVLYQRDIAFFEQFIGTGRVRFVHHGVDTDFFRPAARPETSSLLFAGTYLRNPLMLARVIERLHERRPSLRFDLLVPLHGRTQTGFEPLQQHPAVTWHAGLSDEQLRDLYQRSQLLLLPMNESGANTAVVEALACGLPIVTTDVGGIRDYGGGTIFPIVPNDDDDAMIALVERYLANPVWRNEVGRAGRHFAETTLAWPLIAARHLEAYQELAR